MQGVHVVIRLPGRPEKEINIAACDATARHADVLKASTGSPVSTTSTNKSSNAEANSVSDVSVPLSKKRKLDAVASSVADRAMGPGKDPGSRFAYVYTGKHDHGSLESELERVSSKRWSGVASALAETKNHCDAYLTACIKPKE